MWAVFFACGMVELAILVILLFPFAPAVLTNMVLKALEAVKWYTLRFGVFVAAVFGWGVFKMIEAQREWSLHPSTVSGAALHLALEKKFRSERNFYLMLYVVTLYVIILRVESVMKDRLDAQAEIKRLGGSAPAKKDAKPNNSDNNNNNNKKKD